MFGSGGLLQGYSRRDGGVLGEVLDSSKKRSEDPPSAHPKPQRAHSKNPRNSVIRMTPFPRDLDDVTVTERVEDVHVDIVVVGYEGLLDVFLEGSVNVQHRPRVIARQTERAVNRRGVAPRIKALSPPGARGDALGRPARVRPPPTRPAAFAGGESPGGARPRHRLDRHAFVAAIREPFRTSISVQLSLASTPVVALRS